MYNPFQFIVIVGAIIVICLVSLISVSDSRFVINMYRHSLSIVVHIPYENHLDPTVLRFLKLLSKINEKYQPGTGYENILFDARIQVILTIPCIQTRNDRSAAAELDRFITKLQNLNAEVIHACSGGDIFGSFSSTHTSPFNSFDYMTQAIMAMTKSTSLYDPDDQCYLIAHFGTIIIQPPLTDLASVIRNGCYQSSLIDSVDPLFILTTNRQLAQQSIDDHEMIIVSKRALFAMIHQLNDMQNDLIYDHTLGDLTEAFSHDAKFATTKLTFNNLLTNIKELNGSAVQPTYFEVQDVYQLSFSNQMIQPIHRDENRSIVCPTVILGMAITGTFLGLRDNPMGTCRTASTFSIDPISDIVFRCIDGALDVLPNSNACSIFNSGDDQDPVDAVQLPIKLDFIEIGEPYFIKKSKRWSTGFTIMLAGISTYPPLHSIKLSNMGVKFVELDDISSMQSFYMEHKIVTRNPSIIYINLTANIAGTLNSLVGILEPLIAPIHPTTTTSTTIILLGYRSEDSSHPSLERHEVAFKSLYLEIFQNFGLVFSPPSFSERCMLDGGHRIMVLTPAVGTRLEKGRFSRIKHMLPSCLTSYLFDDLGLTSSEFSNDGSKNPGISTTSNLGTEPSSSISPGMQIQVKGSEFIAMDNVLDNRLLDLLDARLTLLPIAVVGADSYFIPFTDDFEPRSVIEEIIYNHIAPLVVGSIEQAIADGFLGLEWWVQSRATSNPKEYHLDTAITWCRDNGIDVMTCPYCPGVGTVFYLNSIGGSTVVFNQSRTERGLQPPIPKQIAVSYPHKNRLLLFKGDKIHGVLDEDEYNSLDGVRRTLLINYWFNQSAGFVSTPTIPKDFQLIEYARSLVLTRTKNSRHSSELVPFIHIHMQRDLKSDFEDWKSQKLPQEYIRVLRSVDCPDSDFLNTKCLSHAIANPMPGLLFHLASGFIEKYINSLPKLMAFDHWYRWVLEKETNILRLVTIGAFTNETSSDIVGEVNEI